MDRTTPNHRNGALVVPVMAFTMLLGVGTGGDYTPTYHALRENKDLFSKPRSDPAKSNGFAIAADIESVKSTLNLTMTELARCMGVSRQALYNWIAGGTIKHENLARLIELKSAADIIASADLPDQAFFLRRKLPGGKTLLETISSEGSGAEAALALVKLASVEAEQRAELANLFANRKPRNLLGAGIPPLTDKS